jgi:hypothetical protein
MAGRSRERDKASSLKVLLEGDLTTALKVQVSTAKKGFRE